MLLIERFLMQCNRSSRFLVPLSRTLLLFGAAGSLAFAVFKDQPATVHAACCEPDSVQDSKASPPYWSQFRGPGGRGSVDVHSPLPAEIGPDKNIVWKVPLPPGHSSPIVYGNRIYFTAVRDKKLLTIALDRASGKVVWEVEAPYQKLEKIHAIGSHAQATPVTDGERVVSFFGSCGLWCYRTSDGAQLWHLPLGPFKNDLGAGSSPILAGNLVVLNQDHDIDSFLIAVDIRTGKVAWKVDRSEFWVGYATPFLWDSAGHKQVVVAGSLRVVGYDLDTGKEVWTVHGMARAVHMTPTVGPDGTLYVAGWTGGGDETERFDVLTFDDMLAKYDSNKNGTLEDSEIPKGPIKERFQMIDRDKDGHITRAEWDFARRIFDGAMNRVTAIRPGGTGDITKSHVVWSQRKYLPVIPSPVYYREHLYLARNGGLATVLDARTGQPQRHERLFGAANYYSSPVAGDGKIYFASERGEVTVVGVEPEWKVLCKARFGEDIYATPVLLDGRIYLRTAGHLYCFGK
jgi:outer membrane protein assembly factor BamB